VKESIEQARELCLLILAVAKAELGEIVTEQDTKAAGDVSIEKIFEVFQKAKGYPRISAPFLKSECQKVLGLLDQLIDKGQLPFMNITYCKDFFRWLAYPFRTTKVA